MSQDFYDQLQPFNFLADRLDNNKAALGIKYVARQDDRLLPEYPAILLTMERPLTREEHATRIFKVTFYIDIWVFHAQLTESRSVRSLADIALATSVRKFVHSDRTLEGHIIFGFVDGEFPGITARQIGVKSLRVMTTRLSWSGQNRVPYEAS